MGPKKKKLLTLCVIHKGDKVLLGMKKKGFGTGKWNGFGGKVEKGESLEDTAKREVIEEAGVMVDEIVKHGVIEFEFAGNPEIHEVHIFSAQDFSGKPIETDEMRPQWFDVDKIPYDEMWADDKYWLPLLLNGKKFEGKILFGENDKILEKILNEHA